MASIRKKARWKTLNSRNHSDVHKILLSPYPGVLRPQMINSEPFVAEQVQPFDIDTCPLSGRMKSDDWDPGFSDLNRSMGWRPRSGSFGSCSKLSILAWYGQSEIAATSVSCIRWLGPGFRLVKPGGRSANRSIVVLDSPEDVWFGKPLEASAAAGCLCAAPRERLLSQRKVRKAICGTIFPGR